jgi:hypothetical protein
MPVDNTAIKYTGNESGLRSLSRSALALTIRYQKRFPDITGGTRHPGRIRLDKRVAFIEDFSKLMIPDDKLRSLVLKWVEPRGIEGGKEVSKERVDTIVSYCVDKNGSVNGAFDELKAIYDKVMTGHPPAHHRYLLSDLDIARLAKLQRLSDAETKEFSAELHHMVNSTRDILRQPLEGAMARANMTRYLKGE